MLSNILGDILLLGGKLTFNSFCQRTELYSKIPEFYFAHVMCQPSTKQNNRYVLNSNELD